MSGRLDPSKPPAPASGPSAHRFQHRRQERMRGAGTHPAIQKDFQFKLPAPRKALPASAAPSTQEGATTSVPHERPRITPVPSSRQTQAEAGPSRVASPPTSSRRGPRKSALKSSRVALSSSFAATEEGEGSDDTAAAAAEDQTLASIASSSTDSIASRNSRRLPTNSTPAASRRISAVSQPGLSRAGQKGKSRRDDTLEDIDSQASDADDDALEGGDVSMPFDSPAVGLNGASGIEPDPSLPVIPSPSPSSASRLDASAHRSTETSRRSALDNTLVQLDAKDSVFSQSEGLAAVDSPAARAAQRGEAARKRRRQASPGAGETRRPRIDARSDATMAKNKRVKTASASAPANTGKGKGKATKGRPSRVIFLAPEGADISDVEGDATLRDRRSAAAASNAKAMTKPQQKQFSQRLRRALSLVLPNSSSLGGIVNNNNDGNDDDDNAASSSRHIRPKSRKLLNDIDVIWATLDEELKHSVHAQASKSVLSALKALRRHVRERCSAMSEKTDRRSRLVLDLTRARKRKKEVRRFVLETRREAYRSTVEIRERIEDLNKWTREKEDVDKINTFLADIKTASTSWT